MRNFLSKPKTKEYDPYSFLTGSVGETLIEQLFLSLDYKVFRFGMENSIPEIKGLLNGNRSEVSSQIRNMPDFVILKDGKDPFLVEVKYRSSGEFTFKNLLNGYKRYPYSKVLIILVSTKHIKAQFVEDLENRPFTSNSVNYLGRVAELEFTQEEKEKIKKFCEYATQFFDGVKELR